MYRHYIINVFSDVMFQWSLQKFLRIKITFFLLEYTIIIILINTRILFVFTDVSFINSYKLSLCFVCFVLNGLSTMRRQEMHTIRFR